MSKKWISLLFNGMIVLFEIFGFLINYAFHGRISFEYYTQDSNLFALITSSLFCYFLISNSPVPTWLKRLKYASTVGLVITFIVVVFVLGPMLHFNYYHLFFPNSLFYHHLICPILSFITFLFFDDLDTLEKIDSIKVLSFTLFYTIVLVPLNYFGIVEGPYPFLMVKNQPILRSLGWIFVIFGTSFLISLSIYYLHFFFQKKKKHDIL